VNESPVLPERRYSLLQVGLVALICLFLLGISGVILRAYVTIGSSAGTLEHAGHTAMRFVNLQRDIVRLQLATQRLSAETATGSSDSSEVELQRALLGEQLASLQSGIGATEHSAPLVEQLRAQLAQFDVLLATLEEDTTPEGRGALQSEMTLVLTEAERLNRASYDSEETDFLATMTALSGAQHQSQALLLRMVVLLFVLAGALAFSIHQSVRNAFKQAHAHLAKARAERERAERLELDRSHVLEMMAKNRPLPELMSKITNMVSRFQPDLCIVVMTIRDGRLYTLACEPSLQEFTGTLNGTEVSDTTPWGRAATRHEACLLSDVDAFPEDADLALGLKLGFRACWSLPLLARPQERYTAGVLIVWSRQPLQPKVEEIRLVEVARQLASLAIEHTHLADQLEHQARHDALTGLPNRLLLEDRMQQAIGFANRNQQHLAVLFIDLDRFKWINDTQGHSVGDAVLCEVARRLNGCVRQNDTVARLGGDEFVILATGMEEPHHAATIAQKVLQAVTAPIPVNDTTFTITASIGVSLYPQDGVQLDVLLRNADNAMYRAKERGKNQFEFTTPEMDTAILEKLELESALRHALERQEFTLVFQPLYDITPSEPVGAEALLRWHHPTLGMVPPMQFIPLAERSGLIVPLGTWVLKEACRQIQQRAPSWKVAVNVSVLQFVQEDFVSTVAAALQESGLSPDRLELELTESVLMEDMETAEQHLKALHALGVKVAIDDFGTGYSSLVYLQSLSIDSLKIDRSFVSNIRLPLEASHNTPALIQTIVNLARNLNLNVVAEGVETADQLEFLRRVGCNQAQGYLFSKPLPLEQLLKILGPSADPVNVPSDAKDVPSAHA
jgi:diguanylate cyclase (GGDEF)-like protein